LDHDCRPTRRTPIDRLVAECIGKGILGTRDVRRGPSVEVAQDPPRLFPERDQLGVLDPPATRQLLDDQLRIEEQVDLACTQLASQRESPDDRNVLGDVVRPDAEELGDRGVWEGPRIAGIRSGGIDENRAGGGRSGVAASGAIGPDDEARAIGGGGPRGGRPERPLGIAARPAQPAAPSGPEPGGGADEGPGSVGTLEGGGASAPSPRSLRQTIWIGS
jgi:hypothetical protein